MNANDWATFQNAVGPEILEQLNIHSEQDLHVSIMRLGGLVDELLGAAVLVLERRKKAEEGK